MRVWSGDLIAAIASPAGSGGRGIIRISGQGGAQKMASCFTTEQTDWYSLPSARCTHGVWRLPAQIGSDEVPAEVPVSIYHWPDHRSYTGEPLLEIHTYGSPPLLDTLLSQLLQQGIRPADRGEFTLRAFLAGKIDLVQAEGVLGVIDAHDSHEMRLALNQLAGGISQGFLAIRDDLLNLLADLEAGLDFTEEGLTFVSASEVRRRLEQGISFLDQLQTQSVQRMWNPQLPVVILTGPTNVGKSTLYNALIGESAAIVSSEAGTTRNLNSREVCWEGRSLRLIDSAGDEAVRSEVIEQALRLRDQQVSRADLILNCQSTEDWENRSIAPPPDPSPQEHVLSIRTKIDRHLPAGLNPGESGKSDHFMVSAHAGAGVAELRRTILSRLQSTERGEGLTGMTAARCRQSLEFAAEALRGAHRASIAGEGDEFITQEIRNALQSIGEVTGSFYTNDLLDRIFSRFCIGK